VRAVQVSILFEVEDLSQASPATVSRAGMIYLNVEDLGWQPFITSWLQTKQARCRLIDASFHH
jgi:dynein heavy chain, axonemal